MSYRQSAPPENRRLFIAPEGMPTKVLDFGVDNALIGVYDEDLGYAAIMDRFIEDGDRGDTFILVGLHEEGALSHPRTGYPIAHTAFINEFGGVQQGVTIPERPAWRTMADLRQEEMADLIEEAFIEAIDSGKSTLYVLNGRPRAAAQRWLKESIRKFSDPPNAPKTLKRKARNRISSRPVQGLREDTVRGMGSSAARGVKTETDGDGDGREFDKGDKTNKTERIKSFPPLQETNLTVRSIRAKVVRATQMVMDEF